MYSFTDRSEMATEMETEDKKNRTLMALNTIDKASKGSIFGVSILDKALYGTFKAAKRKCKNHFGFEIRLSVEKNSWDYVMSVNKWIAKYNETAAKTLKRSDRLLSNSSYFLKIDRHTYAIVKIGSAYREMISNEGTGNIILSDRIYDNDIYIYIFGKDSYRQKLMLDMMLQDRGENPRMYKVYGDANERSDVAFRSLYEDLDMRDLSTIFLEDGVIDTITSHIDGYLANRDLYTGRGIIYKTGILLYGEPGTGKTSLIKALACKYNYDLILIDMATFNAIEVDTMVHSINIDDKKYIIALEDIDCIIANRENTDIDKDEKKIVNKLLQFLDSNSSPTEVIFIATTNHIELLDEALLREGRFDIRVPVQGIKENKVIEMCKSFNLPDNKINEVIKEIKDSGIDLEEDRIRQSKLQDMILKRSGMSIRSEVCEEDEQ